VTGSAVQDLASAMERLTPAGRLERLRAEGDPARALMEMIEGVKGLILSDTARAGELSIAAVDLARAVGDAACLARALAVRGHALAYATRFDESIAAAAEGAHIARAAGLSVEEATALLAQVQPMSRLGRLGEAFDLACSARDIYEREGEPVRAARAEVNAGVLLRMQDRPAEAISLFEHARAALAGDGLALAQLESNRAEALLEVHRFAEAEGAFRRSLGLLREAGNQWAAGMVEGNLADLLNRQGRLGAALRHFEHAIRERERGASPGDLARLRAERAEVLLSLGLVDEALAEYDAATTALTGAGLVMEAARGRLGMAAALLRLGQSDRAAEAAAGAQRTFDEQNHHTGAARAGLLLARIVAARGDRAGAKSLVRAAAARLKDRPADRAAADLQLAALEIEAGQVASASDRAAGALATARALGLSSLAIEALHLSARALRDGPAGARLERYLLAVRELEKFRSRLPADRLRVAMAGDRTRLFEEAIECAVAAGDPPALAFELSERSRARALLDLLSGGAELSELHGDEGGDAGDLARQHAACIAELNARAAAAWNAKAPPETDSRQKQADDTAALEGRLAHLETRLGATREFSPIFQAPVDIAAAARLAPVDGAMVSYSTVRGRVIAFVVGSEGLRMTKDLGSAERIEAAAGRLLFQVSRALARGLEALPTPRLVEQAVAEGAACFDLLVRPLDAALGGAGPLVVIPAGPLHGLPFEAMHDGAGFLLERRRIAYAPSASILSRLAAPESRRVVVVGVSDEVAPHMEEEATSIAGLFPGSTLLAGGGATLGSLRAVAADAGLIHIACHGTFDAAHPMSARLRLADGWVTARELLSLRLPGSIVVLSGCDTGRLSSVGAEEIHGLARAFLGAGAGGLVVARWSLHDGSTVRLMDGLYRALTPDWNPTDVPGALHAAQRRLMLESPHPAAWAPLMWIGTP
jgi:CHAT domain-containing protein/tetratricopeptide (TPR) repeat protein